MKDKRSHNKKISSAGKRIGCIEGVCASGIK
jgi:hypothetical protein